jgi:hypothetical protein
MADKLNLNAPNVTEQELSVTEIRESDNEELWDKVYGWLDEAQGQVFSGERTTVYLVIKVQ